MPKSLPSNPPAALQPSKDVPPSKLLAWWRGDGPLERYGRHVLAVFFWVYFVGQFFVFDFDAWLINQLPDWLRWVVIYKLLVFLFIAAIVLNFVPRRRFWPWAAYVFLYPVTRALALLYYLIFGVGWVLLKLKSWTALFAVLNVMLAFIDSFKVNFLFYVLALIGIVTVLLASDPGDLLSATILLVFVTLALVVRRLVAIFRPSPIFNFYVRAMAWIMDNCRRHLIKPVSLKGVDTADLTLSELEQRYGKLSVAIILSEFCALLEAKFKE